MVIKMETNYTERMGNDYLNGLYAEALSRSDRQLGRAIRILNTSGPSERMWDPIFWGNIIGIHSAYVILTKKKITKPN